MQPLKSLKANKEWKPLQSSTMTNFHSIKTTTNRRHPKTNPHHSSIYNRQSTASISYYNQQHLISMATTTPPPRSLFDPNYRRFNGVYDRVYDVHNIKSEQFNLPSLLAKQKGIKGIVFNSLNSIYFIRALYYIYLERIATDDRAK